MAANRLVEIADHGSLRTHATEARLQAATTIVTHGKGIDGEQGYETLHDHAVAAGILGQAEAVFQDHVAEICHNENLAQAIESGNYDHLSGWEEADEQER